MFYSLILSQGLTEQRGLNISSITVSKCREENFLEIFVQKGKMYKSLFLMDLPI